MTLRAIGRPKWRELKAEAPRPHRGRRVDADTAKGDRLAGLNADTVEDDLVFAAIIEPRVHQSRADYDEWADELSEGEFQMLLRDAWALVNVAQVDPKSLPSSQTRSNGGSTRVALKAWGLTPSGHDRATPDDERDEMLADVRVVCARAAICARSVPTRLSSGTRGRRSVTPAGTRARGGSGVAGQAQGLRRHGSRWAWRTWHEPPRRRVSSG